MDRVRPTPAEWEILNALWKLGPATVRDVHDTITLDRPVQYTTTLKLMQILAGKGLVERDESARAHKYKPTVERKEMQADAVEDLLDRVFGGSAADMLQRTLWRRKLKKREFSDLKKVMKSWESKR